ncbi:hypothetical protein ANCCEY_12108 [Ancylostoma ceylanicum]|uniref:Uncharacterized protein n=1 Tax=Ancylostoma ceylanicum TaxID=53326 RepID=A0A0D6LC34_9BILA|nr:hypothetical protein ANCCEY_12108 [Ancylostoma ceylanicum]
MRRLPERVFPFKKAQGRTLVVLLFSEQEVKKPLADAWKKLSTNGKAHVFRVGTAKPTNELFADEGETFEELLACSEVEGIFFAGPSRYSQKACNHSDSNILASPSNPILKNDTKANYDKVTFHFYPPNDDDDSNDNHHAHDDHSEGSSWYLDIAAAAVGHLPIASNAVRVSLVRYSGPGRAETLFHLDKHANKDDLIELV